MKPGTFPRHTVLQKVQARTQVRARKTQKLSRHSTWPSPDGALRARPLSFPTLMVSSVYDEVMLHSLRNGASEEKLWEIVNSR